MAQRPQALQYLLLRLFPSNDLLAEYVANIDHSQIWLVTAALPGTTVARLTFSLEVVKQLQAQALDGTDRFEDLAQRFPGQAAMIEAAQSQYMADDNPMAAGDRGAADLVAGEVSDAEIATQEKITGERATFLDVSYLGLGHRRAQSVAKLRMTFADGDYHGTAFLIAEGLLLTAHHNLWEKDGTRAQVVEAVFDYERAVSGTQRASKTVGVDLEAALGEAEGDWALLPLAQPEEGRPLAPLANTAAAKGDRVAIVQHPNGMVKQVALHNNLVLGAEPTRLTYLTDTEGGSSGAPVFNNDWEVVALHRAGVEVKKPLRRELIYNEGTPIAYARARARALGFNI